MADSIERRSFAPLPEPFHREGQGIERVLQPVNRPVLKATAGEVPPQPGRPRKPRKIRPSFQPAA
ncbi:MAG: hypothetical protein ACM3IJ_04720 [Candidatus Levyibacteriota bacterium]